MATLAENRQQALDWVNAQRAEFNLPPLEDLCSGMRGQVRRCSLGNSLEEKYEFYGNGSYGLAVEGPFITATYHDGTTINREASYTSLGEKFPLPEAVAIFEWDFERGYYPDLAKNSGYFSFAHENRPTADDSPFALTGEV